MAGTSRTSPAAIPEKWFNMIGIEAEYYYHLAFTSGLASRNGSPFS
jgi:hypothetical protein